MRTSLGGGISMTKFKVIFGAVALCCTVGLVFAHWAFARSRNRRFPRVLAVVSLVIGYCSAVGLALICFALLSGLLVPYKHYEEPPDFTSSDGVPDFTVSEPAEKPVPKAPAPRP